MRLERVTLDKLRVEDERSYRHIALCGALKHVLVRDRVPFLIPRPGTDRLRWDRALFLNLTFWSASNPADVLESDTIPADVMMHAAWHHLAGRALATDATTPLSVDAALLGESIASAFDLYLVGRLLGHSPDAMFLETQVPAMADAAEQAGMSDDAFESMLDDVARDPDRAFEDLRELLFDVCTALVNESSAEQAADTIARFDSHRFGPLLHHYELSTWILHSRAYGRDVASRDPRVLDVDATLRRVESSLDWLEQHWVHGLSGNNSSSNDEYGAR